MLHLETLFLIGFVCVAVYFLFFYKGKKRGAERLEEAVQTLFAIPKAKQVRAETSSSGRINKSEERCREIFQSIFGVPFESVRPNWLKNPATGRNLELDGYSHSVITPIGRGLAFEYDGGQHARYTPHFHRGGPEEFIYQTKKDKFKDQKCREHGVMLIRIPDFVHFTDLDRYIRDQLAKRGVRGFAVGGS